MSAGQELHEYFWSTGRQRRDTALHVLEGFLQGVELDHVINLQEHRELRNWIDAHGQLGDRDSVFRELLATLRVAIADGKLEPEEIADLRALCQRAASTSQYYDGITHAIQELHGILHGVVSDLSINEAELTGLRAWLTNYRDLRSLWPVTEIEAVIVQVLANGRVEESEHRMLLHFFAEFAQNPAIKEALPPLLASDLMIAGVCAVAPTIHIPAKVFCFTGISSRGPRRLVAEKVVSHGGVFIDSMRENLDYLIIGDEGNPCWAFSCYGRKVERAVEMRRKGHRILLIHEKDFWTAVS